MYKRLFSLLLICSVVVSLNAAAPTPAAAQAGEYKVLSTTELELFGGTSTSHAHLAPSGEIFAYGDFEELCIYAIDGEKQHCTPLPTEKTTILINTDSLVWSPDSTKLAFTSDFLRNFRDPGIWMMDATTGEITKATGEGYERANLLENDVMFDLAPRWMPDSQHLVFLRYKQFDKKRTGPFVSVLDITTGEIEEQTNLLSESIDIYLTGISADGSLLAFNNDGRGMKIMGGLWIYDFNKKDFEKIYAATKSRHTPRVIIFSPDATKILITDYSYVELATSSGDPEKSPVRIIDVETNKAMLVDDENFVRRVGWSPDGKAIAYIVYNPFKPEINGLYISTTLGAPGKMVLSGLLIVPTPGEGQPIIWATNNTLLISKRDRGFKITVVKLGVE